MEDSPAELPEQFFATTNITSLQFDFLVAVDCHGLYGDGHHPEKSIASTSSDGR
jgi:hypothetical protein